MKMKYMWVLFLLGLSSGCVDRHAILANPPEQLVNQVNEILPLAEKFVIDSQEEALDKGLPLSLEELEIAKELGVSSAEKVRVHYVDTLPFPKDPKLANLASSLGYSSPSMGAYTYGYGIWMKHREKGFRQLLAHELIHVRQAEELGLKEQTRQYLMQLYIFGYRQAPLEIQAYSESEKY
ncbi:Hypothetical protein PBPRB1696 [Photobacterium profundum SS9]|uniref:DUF4157 domain-containing protein n=2 Tax=Photobacterium profundum TaxID=74109 RepID=Q6LGM4_PHOPR|nr:Hypothetical protein PBPRB1696 [Photobacterium profundum SS9]